MDRTECEIRIAQLEAILDNTKIHSAEYTDNEIQEMELELYQLRCEELERENQLLRNKFNTVSIRFKEMQEHNLQIARRIVKNDRKAIGNIIFNMYFGKTPADSVGFCEIFELKKLGYCKDSERTCTDCIDKFLRDYYTDTSIGINFEENMTLRDVFRKYTEVTFSLMTQEGEFVLSPKQIREVLNGNDFAINKGGKRIEIPAEHILNEKVSWGNYLWKTNTIYLVV